MGMYDTISIADPLPFTDEMKELGLDQNSYNWQTKDLGESMGHFIIQGGELFEELYKTTTHIPGDPYASSFMDRVGRVERSDPYLEKVNYHGIVFFCNIVQNAQDKWDCWIEFKAYFTHGKVDKIELFKFEKKDNADRKKVEAEYWEEMRRKDNLWYNKYIFHTRTYRKFKLKIWQRFWAKVYTIAFRLSYL